MPKWIRRILIGVAALLLLVASALGFGAWRYSQALAINTPNGIDESGYVRVGGIDQWIQIRGQDRTNPVLLWLNGGPGFSTTPSTLLYGDWEKHFTVVMWDQRGEGKTFEKSGTSVAPTMTIDRMAQDGLEVTDYIRHRLRKDKIILLGHSWGSILGIHMVKQRPDLFYAYVGTGQVQYLRRNIQEAYPLILARARADNNQGAVKELEEAGPPPYAQAAKYFVPLKWANAFDPPMRRRLSAAGLWAMTQIDTSFFAGADFSQNTMLEPMLDEDLPSVATQFEVPMIIIEGPNDLVTAAAKSYFDKMTAPHKEYLLLPGAGHLAIFNDAADFLKVLLAHVRPLANKG